MATRVKIGTKKMNIETWTPDLDAIQKRFSSIFKKYKQDREKSEEMPLWPQQ